MRGEGMVPWAYFSIECLVEMHGFQKGGGGGGGFECERGRFRLIV